MAPVLPVSERKLRHVAVSWAAPGQATACQYLLSVVPAAQHKGTWRLNSNVRFSNRQVSTAALSMSLAGCACRKSDSAILLMSTTGIRGCCTRTFLRDTRAREAQADKYFQEIIEIADAATPETVNVARLRVDSRKFTVARLAPKKYGDHIKPQCQRRRQQQLPTANPHSVQQRW
jgi:Bacteriophage Sf6, terminase small subunit-like